MTNNITPGALSGIVVLDLTRVLAGPYSTMTLADLGAEVIKIEQPQTGDDTREFGPFVNGESIYYMTNNRNKKGVTLNLKHSNGKAIFIEMLKQADVVVENYRPGTMEKLGLGYEELAKINPRIIYGSISGFGHYGPYKMRPGFDIIAQAMSGVMSTTGWPNTGPTRTGTALGDVLAGLWLTIGVLAAIQGRNITGQGQKVDISLVDAGVSAMGNINMVYFAENRLPGRIGNRYEATYPYDSFTCLDGGSCVIGAGNNKLWKELCKLMNLEDIADNPRYKNIRDRVAHHQELKEIVEAWTSTLSAEDVVRLCLAAGVPAAPIMNIDQVSKDQHIAVAREMIIEQQHPVAGKIKVTGSPLKMSATPVTYRTASPALGEYNSEVYGRFIGLSEEELLILENEGAI